MIPEGLPSALEAGRIVRAGGGSGPPSSAA